MFVNCPELEKPKKKYPGENIQIYGQWRDLFIVRACFATTTAFLVAGPTTQIHFFPFCFFSSEMPPLLSAQFYCLTYLSCHFGFDSYPFLASLRELDVFSFLNVIRLFPIFI